MTPARLPLKARMAGCLIYGLFRLLGATFRWRLHDPAGVRGNQPATPMIWMLWHNRVFSSFLLHRRYLGERDGAILTSASKDGDYIAATTQAAGLSAVRGSSSRRGASALLALRDWVARGYDVAIIPDGPRGPRYRLGPGAIKLAQLTGASLLPVRVHYGSAWVFNSWDRFQLPKPFTTVDIYLEPLVTIPAELTSEAFEEERQRVERIMNPDNETD